MLWFVLLPMTESQAIAFSRATTIRKPTVLDLMTAASNASRRRPEALDVEARGECCLPPSSHPRLICNSGGSHHRSAFRRRLFYRSRVPIPSRRACLKTLHRIRTQPSPLPATDDARDRLVGAAAIHLVLWSQRDSAQGLSPGTARHRRLQASRRGRGSPVPQGQY